MKPIVSFEALLDKLHLHRLAAFLREDKKYKMSRKYVEISQAWVQNVEDEYQLSMECLQKRAALQEKRMVLLSSNQKLSYDEVQQVSHLETEMKKFKNKFLEHQKKNYCLRQEDGLHNAWIREFYVNEKRRKHRAKSKRRLIIMSKSQINSCLSLGGCCSRGCGCCSKPRATFLNEDTYSHCTSECACCLRFYDEP